MSRLKLALIATAIAASIVPAASADEPITRSVEVDLGGLDLANPADMTAAEQRIRKAARRVCTDSLAPQTLEERRNFKTCYDGALEGAFERLGPRTGGTFAKSETSQG